MADRSKGREQEGWNEEGASKTEDRTRKEEQRGAGETEVGENKETRRGEIGAACAFEGV